MTGRDVVSWAGPVEKAAQGIRVATELLEAKRFEQGVEQLRDVQRNLDLAIQFIREKA
jgi:hypothetical protein